MAIATNTSGAKACSPAPSRTDARSQLTMATAWRHINRDSLRDRPGKMKQVPT
jgi:hypothetical protein